MQKSDLTRIRWIFDQNRTGNLGMSECPGKFLDKSRTGKPIHRNIEADLLHWKSIQGVSIILCLLNDFEIRTLGVKDKVYKEQCIKNQIQFIQYPIIQMSVPTESQRIKEILNTLANNIKKGHKVVIHCRGGIGRTATMVCALLKLLDQQTSWEQSIKFVRKIRDKRCVESKKQQDWIKHFYESSSQ